MLKFRYLKYLHEFDRELKPFLIILKRSIDPTNYKLSYRKSAKFLESQDFRNTIDFNHSFNRDAL